MVSSSRYLVEQKWVHNITEFQQWFDGILTEGEGQRRLKHMYFLYSIELRALSKVLPFFECMDFNSSVEVKFSILKTKCYFWNYFMKSSHFLCISMKILFWPETKKKANKLKDNFQLYFRNISRIMDCVGFKCQPWEKLRIQGLDTSLKFMFSNKLIANMPESGPSHEFQLTKQEIVSLFNAFGRIFTSVRELENFWNLLQNIHWIISGETYGCACFWILEAKSGISFKGITEQS